MENVILVVFLVGVSILVYVAYNKLQNIEKVKQQELDKEMAADWDIVEAEIAKED